jgi:hypothetical protein
MRRAALAGLAAITACGAFTACAHDEGYRGGVYASFTFRAAPTLRPGHVNGALTMKRGGERSGGDGRADLDRWIANDELALRRIPRTAQSAYGTHLASLLNELWLAHRDAELARRLAAIGTLLPDASDDVADRRFFQGDRDAAFAAAAARHAGLRDTPTPPHAEYWAGVIDRFRSVHEGPHPDGRSIAAALLEGDAYAACGRYRDARVTWYRAFSTSVLQPPGRYQFFAAWTSAMRRLLHYRSESDRPTLGNGCRGLPPPIVDPVG